MKAFSNLTESPNSFFVRLKLRVSSKFYWFWPFNFMLRELDGFFLAAAFILLLMSSSDIVKVKLSKESFNTESGLRDKAFWRKSNLSKVYFVNVFDLWVFWYSDRRVLSKDSDWLLFWLENFESNWRLWLYCNLLLSYNTIDSADIMLLFYMLKLFFCDEESLSDKDIDCLYSLDFFKEGFYPSTTDWMIVISEESVRLLLLRVFFTPDWFC